MGIEPTLVAWEATVLPLNYTRARPRILGRFSRAGKLPTCRYCVLGPAQTRAPPFAVLYSVSER